MVSSLSFPSSGLILCLWVTRILIPLLPSLYLAAELLPFMKAGHASGGRKLGIDKRYIPEAVIVKARHGGEVRSKGLAAQNRINPLLEYLDRGSDPLLW